MLVQMNDFGLGQSLFNLCRKRGYQLSVFQST